MSRLTEDRTKTASAVPDTEMLTGLLKRHPNLSVISVT